MTKFLANNERHNLCPCGQPRAPRRKRCRVCLDIESLKMQERYAERKLTRLCIQCGGRALKGQVHCKRCKAIRQARHCDLRMGALRRRLRELLDRGRIPLPPRLQEKGRFILGAMPVIEAPETDHWRPTEAACRQYAREHPDFEGLITVVREQNKRITHRTYLLTRHQSTPRRERIDLTHIPTTTEVPWRQYN